jgi:hypothetical protein
MSTLARVCMVLAFIPVVLGLFIAVVGMEALGWLFGIGVDGEPTMRSAVRFLGACFAGFGVIMWVGARRREWHWLLLVIGGVTLIAGVAARGLSFAVDGVPTQLAAVLALAELLSGVLFVILGWWSRPTGLDS